MTSSPGEPAPRDRCVEGLRLAVVLERDVDARAIRGDLALLDGEVQLHDLADAQIAQRLGGGLDGVLRGLFPRLRARTYHFGDAIDAFRHVPSLGLGDAGYLQGALWLELGDVESRSG